MWSESDFFEYKMNLDLKEIPEDKVLILTMRQIRQMDVLVPRGLSYERTVYMFFLSMELDENLTVLKKLKNIVVLLDKAGALRKKNGKWSVLFSPKETEGLSIGLDEPLVAIYQDMCRRATKNGDMTILPLDNVSVRALLCRRYRINFLDTYCSNYPGGYLAVAQDIVINGTDELFKNVPVCSYGALTTVDLEEMEGYRIVKALMDDYLLQVEYAKGSQVKPLTIAVFGAPGSGKSFGIKQIAKSSGTFKTFTLNLSQFKEYDEMAIALKQALETTEGKTPLIFFDEFDSGLQGVSRGWLKYLLAPMQDGEFNCGGSTISIQNAIFVFAGGTASSFGDFLPSEEKAEEQETFRKIKGPDFVSRLKGILNIKGPDPSSITDKAYIIRRALLLRSLIKRKVPSIYDSETGTVNISKGLLGAFLGSSGNLLVKWG